MENDRFVWHKGDVVWHENEKERDRALAEDGYEYFIEPGHKPRKLKKDEKEEQS